MEGKRSRGRPKKRWLDDIKEWINKYDPKIRTIYEKGNLAKDKETWKVFIDKVTKGIENSIPLKSENSDQQSS